MDANGVSLFTALNSSYVPDIQLRSVFGLVAVKGGPVLAEGYNLNLDSLDPTFPGYTLRLTATVPQTQGEFTVAPAQTNESGKSGS